MDGENCGGTLISHSHVVSAAHCFNKCKGTQPRNLTVTLGDHDTSKNETGQITVGVKELKCHPKFLGNFTYFPRILYYKCPNFINAD